MLINYVRNGKERRFKKGQRLHSAGSDASSDEGKERSEARTTAKEAKADEAGTEQNLRRDAWPAANEARIAY